MLPMIDRLRQIPEARVGEGPDCWTVEIQRSSSFDFELDIPKHDVFEWWVTVRDHATNAVVWQDWTDYAGYVPKAEEDEAQLAADMRSDIEWFVATLLRSTDFRVGSRRYFLFLRERIGQWHLDGEWREIWSTPRTT